MYGIHSVNIQRNNDITVKLKNYKMFKFWSMERTVCAKRS